MAENPISSGSIRDERGAAHHSNCVFFREAPLVDFAKSCFFYEIR